jgi:hypothetical protein
VVSRRKQPEARLRIGSGDHFSSAELMFEYPPQERFAPPRELRGSATATHRSRQRGQHFRDRGDLSAIHWCKAVFRIQLARDRRGSLEERARTTARVPRHCHQADHDVDLAVHTRGLGGHEALALADGSIASVFAARRLAIVWKAVRRFAFSLALDLGPGCHTAPRLSCCVSMGALVDGLVSAKIDGFPVTRPDSL